MYKYLDICSWSPPVSLLDFLRLSVFDEQSHVCGSCRATFVHSFKCHCFFQSYLLYSKQNANVYSQDLKFAFWNCWCHNFHHEGFRWCNLPIFHNFFTKYVSRKILENPKIKMMLVLHMARCATCCLKLDPSFFILWWTLDIHQANNSIRFLYRIND